MLFRSIFEKLKIEANIARSQALKGRKHTPKAIEKIKARRALQVISEETKIKMSKAHRGRKNSPEAIEKTRQAHIGSKRSEETKQKLRECRKYYIKLICKYCGIETVRSSYNRWHGENCKYKT